jgi:murein DD-endopeptidase MepM/ murein hydrolase activator NlpD
MLRRFVSKSYTKKRAASLAAVCLLVILGSVAALNLVGSPNSARDLIHNSAISSAGYQAVRTRPLALNIPSSTPSSRTDAAAVTDADLQYLGNEKLLIPVVGVESSRLRDSFADSRSEGRQHEAIDIAAPQGTPVLAATDGMTARLFNSRLGGTTLYQFDKSGQFVFYYAHLSGYADGVVQGKALHKGDVLGYVGDTGNAGTGNFHLHFAISKLSTPWKWSGGNAIDPYPLLGGKTTEAGK